MGTGLEALRSACTALLGDNTCGFILSNCESAVSEVEAYVALTKDQLSRREADILCADDSIARTRTLVATEEARNEFEQAIMLNDAVRQICFHSPLPAKACWEQTVTTWSDLGMKFISHIDSRRKCADARPVDDLPRSQHEKFYASEWYISEYDCCNASARTYLEPALTPSLAEARTAQESGCAVSGGLACVGHYLSLTGIGHNM